MTWVCQRCPYDASKMESHTHLFHLSISRKQAFRLIFCLQNLLLHCIRCPEQSFVTLKSLFLIFDHFKHFLHSYWTWRTPHMWQPLYALFQPTRHRTNTTHTRKREMGSGDSSVVRAPDSWLKGHRFESLLERQENFLLRGRLFVLTLILVSIPPLCYHSST